MMSRRGIMAIIVTAVLVLGAGTWLTLRSISPEFDPPLPAAIGPSTPMPGQIVVDPAHPAWLKYHAGGSFFMCGPGDPEGFLYRGTLRADGTRDGDQMALIEELKGTGANSIYLMAVRSHGGDGEATHNPFIGHDPAKGLNPAVLDQWETWFSEMDRHGIVIYFFIYDDSARVWDTGDTVELEERVFIHALVNRFKKFKHLIWVVAEEYEERYSPRRVVHIAAEIRITDEYGHPIAVHKLGGLDFSEFARSTLISQFAIQYGEPEGAQTSKQIHDDLVDAWEEADSRYNLNLSESHPIIQGTELRRRNWAAAMAGAYVMVYGMDIAGTPRPDLVDCGNLVQFMESTNFQEMAPRDDLAFADTDYVLARPEHSYIAYGVADDRDRAGVPLKIQVHLLG